MGEHYQMPLVGGTGLGKPLKSIVRPLRNDIPIYLGAEGPKNVALAAEICDGWLPMFFSPKADSFYREALAEGFARRGARRTADDFEVACVVPTIVGDDVEACADLLRPTLALYIGGMGAKDRNFHKDVFARLGYEAECEKIQEAYLAGRKDEAASLRAHRRWSRTSTSSARRTRSATTSRLARELRHHDPRQRPAVHARGDRRAGPGLGRGAQGVPGRLAGPRRACGICEGQPDPGGRGTAAKPSSWPVMPPSRAAWMLAGGYTPR